MDAIEAVEVRIATLADVDSIVALTGELFVEVSHAAEGDAQAVARALVAGDPAFWALLAFKVTQPVGLATVSEVAAIYAGGRFGCIQEFYVRPQHRSSGIGRSLLCALQRMGKERNWQRLEVTAALRAVAFYRSYGFDDSGPRLKLPLRKSET